MQGVPDANDPIPGSRAQALPPRRARRQYGLIAALIAVMIIGTVTTVGENLDGVFNSIGTSLGKATGGTGGTTP
jgi:Flp pilus assembly pilin Flp